MSDVCRQEMISKDQVFIRGEGFREEGGIKDGNSGCFPGCAGSGDLRIISSHECCVIIIMKHIG